MTAFAIKLIPNVEHTRRVLASRIALRLVPPSEGVWPCDSGRDAQRGDALAAPSEGSQSGTRDSAGIAITEQDQPHVS